MGKVRTFSLDVQDVQQQQENQVQQTMEEHSYKGCLNRVTCDCTPLMRTVKPDYLLVMVIDVIAGILPADNIPEQTDPFVTSKRKQGGHTLLVFRPLMMEKIVFYFTLS